MRHDDICFKIILVRERGEGLDETVLALVSCVYVVVHCAGHFIFVSFDNFCEVKMIKVSSPIAQRKLFLLLYKNRFTEIHLTHIHIYISLI